MTPAPVAFAQPPSASGLDGHAGRIADDMISVIRQAAATMPRNLQTAIGPSEVGHPCLRRLAYRILDLPKVNTEQDPLPSIIGTGTHSWLSQHIVRCAPDRYVADIEVDYPVKGSLDLLDTWTRTVIDFKVPGVAAMKKYRSQPPGQQYEIQTHLYGLGLYNAGYTPEHVAIVFLPRAGRLDGTHVWSEPWNWSKAVDAINRLGTLTAYIGMGDEDQPRHILQNIPKTPTFCGYCPWALAGSEDLSVGCPGDLKVS